MSIYAATITARFEASLTHTLMLCLFVLYVVIYSIASFSNFNRMLPFNLFLFLLNVEVHHMEVRVHINVMCFVRTEFLFFMVFFFLSKGDTV
jgi:hypothetical protein